jgi:hypothetical protein
MMVLLMTPTANTLLSAAIGFLIGVVAMAAWYGVHKPSKEQEFNFDEADVYSSPLKKVK